MFWAPFIISSLSVFISHAITLLGANELEGIRAILVGIVFLLSMICEQVIVK